jgi:hypothetical protein
MRTPEAEFVLGSVRRRLAVAAMLCASLLASALPSRAASAGDYELRLDATPAPELAGRHVGDFVEAVRAFGRPARLQTARIPPACTASWPKLGLDIAFAAARAGTCTAGALGRWLSVTARAPRWRTTAGLRVGDTERRLHALYPATRRLDFLGLGLLWELETGGPLCDGGPPLAVAARVRAGYVSALVVVHVPACG